MSRVGILGGGQLGRMLALAGYPLGERFVFLAPSSDAPAHHVGELWTGAYDDRQKLEDLARTAKVVTYELESVPLAAARWLAERVPVYPPPKALEVSQDRLLEKAFFESQGIPTAAFAAVDDERGLREAVARIGLPAMLKTRRFGYDGKGQALLRAPEDVAAAWIAIGGGAPLILEKFVTFERELSMLAVRSKNGQSTAFYPLVENHHRDGILRLSIAPAPDAAALQKKAEEYASRILAALDYVGVLAIELFQVGGELLANEMAPRVHNSGHLTIEGAETSQFENHLRAVLGLPLGITAALGHSAMVNLIGTVPKEDDVLAVPGAHLHLYGKEPQPGRKLGHVTLRAASHAAIGARLAQLQALVG